MSRLVPVYLALGITTDWRLIYGDKEFFTITKNFHNALQGAELTLTSEAKEAYLKHNRISAEMLQEDYDVVIVHDPQPAALRYFKDRQHKRKWIWRCHIDSSEPNGEVWEFLRPYVQEYDAAVFTMKAFRPADVQLVACRSEFVSAQPAAGVRVFPLDRVSVGGVGVDVTTEFASQ
ncbi:MAG: hypothetical protein WCA27_31545, partial [Candidatus Sulfotelmatobacter sp.]